MKFLEVKNPQRDDNGMYVHPQHPKWDADTTNDEMLQWLSDNNFNIHYDYFESTASEDLQDKWFEEGINDCTEWVPKCDKEGAILLTIFDTDNGPVAWFLAPVKRKATSTTNHQLNIIKLADLIAQEEATGDYLTCKDNLIRLNGLVEAHAIITDAKPMYYDQTDPEPAKDYAD